MKNDNVISLKKPEPFVEDPITELLRNGARKLLTEALEAEIQLFIQQYKELVNSGGNQRVVRNGYLPEREIQTGIGPVSVKVPRVRDRHPQGNQKFDLHQPFCRRICGRPRVLSN